MSDQTLTRSADERLDRLEADVGEIKDTLNNRVLGTLAEHGERLGALEAGQEALKTGQEALVVRQEALVVRQEALEAGQKALVVRQEALEAGQKALEVRQEALEAGQKALEVGQDALEAGQRGLQDELHYVKDRVDAIADHFGIT